MANDLKNLLLEGKARLGVWGCGYIGFTSMIYFAQEGVYSVGHDVDKKTVETVKKGQIHIPNLHYWIGYPVEPLMNKMIQVTPEWKDMLAEDVRVHLIAVPTERNGEPWFEPLQDVMAKLSQRKPTKEKPDLIIIESTLTPGMFDRVVVKILEAAGHKVGENFLAGIAPRRDWFDSPEKNLKTLARVIGGTNAETSSAMRDVLGIVCTKLITADHHVVELVKSVENSILHVCAVYASQLACAYPDVDISEVLRLASTHWRIPLYYPSVGTGGYCIPLSSKYVKEGATRPEYLHITEETLKSDYNQPYYVADVMAKKVKGGKIGVLGLTYKRDLKVHVLSPSLKIIERLKQQNINVKVYDPYYTAEEVRKIVGTDTFNYPDDLSQFDGLIIIPTHRAFVQMPKNILLRNLRKGQTILDNEGAWDKWRSDLVAKGIDYHRVGDKGWCLT